MNKGKKTAASVRGMRRSFGSSVEILPLLDGLFKDLVHALADGRPPRGEARVLRGHQGAHHEPRVADALVVQGLEVDEDRAALLVAGDHRDAAALHVGFGVVEAGAVESPAVGHVGLSVAVEGGFLYECLLGLRDFGMRAVHSIRILLKLPTPPPDQNRIPIRPEQRKSGTNPENLV